MVFLGQLSSPFCLRISALNRRGRLLRPDNATVHKEMEQDRVLGVHQKVVLGSQEAVARAPLASVCSRTINTAFLERQHAKDRGRDARKEHRFSKDWRVHEAMTYFTLCSYDF
jgi:hypothetical protein